MLDCGIHPAKRDMNSLPFFDYCEPSEVDILLISHFHLDHAAALPYFLSNSGFKGRVFMTHATKAIYSIILQDFVRVSAIPAAKNNLYEQKDLDRSMARIEGINFMEYKRHNGIKFWCYPAGHVLGGS